MTQAAMERGKAGSERSEDVGRWMSMVKKEDAAKAIQVSVFFFI